MKRLKTAVIGCGAIAERKLIPAAVKLPEIDLVGLVDQNPERARNLAHKFGIKGYYQGFEDVLNSIELAIVATPNSSHSRISCEFLNRGIHVLCEKPMATSARECELMIVASESSNVKLMVDHYMRFTSNARIARQFLMQKIIRDVKTIKCSFGHVFHWPSVSNFYDKYEISGGGVLLDFGVHLIDLVHWLTGQELKLLSYCVSDSGTCKIEKDVEVELEVFKGTRCSMTVSWTRKLPNTFELRGDNGCLKVYLDNYQILEFFKHGRNAAGDNEPIRIIGAKCDPYLRQLEHFVHCIIEDKSPSVSGSDGLRTLKLVEACYNSFSLKN